jgi:hypothetical protein
LFNVKQPCDTVIGIPTRLDGLECQLGNVESKLDGIAAEPGSAAVGKAVVGVSEVMALIKSTVPAN